MNKVTFDTHFTADPEISLSTEQPKKLVWQTPKLELIGPVSCTGNRPFPGPGDNLFFFRS